jgi:hypothetical protein
MSLASCSGDFFEPDTTRYLTTESAGRATDADPSKTASFVDAIYSVLVQYDLVSTNHDSFGLMAILHARDMMTEDIAVDKLHWFNFDYQHDNRDKTYRRTNVIWTYFYTAIANANIVLGMTSPESTEVEIKAARGQAFALRGFSYYYLIQLYQQLYPVSESGNKPGIPLYYASNEEKENSAKRNPVSDVLAQIEEDLLAAIENLDGWKRDSKNKVDYAVANGLLARYYLLTEQWDKAVSAAREARKDYSIMSANTLFDGFMDINNSEWMWGFDHNAETTTLYASFFSHISNLTGGYAGLDYSARLIDKRLYESIPDSDTRKQLFQNPAGTVVPPVTPSDDASAWRLPYANLKFGYDGAFTMDYLYMRASEMVLIEAEALAHKGDGSGAATALKTLLAQRDPTWNKATVSVDDVWQQRRIELWGEGFSAFDLVRLDKGIDRNYDGSNHEPSCKFAVPAGDIRWIYQIPQRETNENPEIPDSENNK